MGRAGAAIQRMSNGPLGLIPAGCRSWQKAWLAGEGSNLQHPAPKAGVLPIELPAKDGCGLPYRMSRLDQLDSIPEGVVDVTAAHVGHLFVEAHRVPGVPERPHTARRGPRPPAPGGPCGRAGSRPPPRVQRHPAVGEPASASGREHRGLLALLETQQTLVEVPSLGLLGPGASPAGRGRRRRAGSPRSTSSEPRCLPGERLLGGGPSKGR